MRVPNSVVHVAGKTDRDGFLRCSRCLAVLQDHRPLSWEQLLALPYSVYPEGALIENGGTWQCLTLAHTEPTCAPAPDWLRVSYRAIEEAFSAAYARALAAELLKAADAIDAALAAAPVDVSQNDAEQLAQAAADHALMGGDEL